MGGKIPCFSELSPSKNKKKTLNQPTSVSINEALQKETNIQNKNIPNKKNFEEEKKEDLLQNKNLIINKKELKGEELKAKNIQQGDPSLNNTLKKKVESKILEKNNEDKQIKEVINTKNIDESQTLTTNNDKKEEITEEEKEKKRMEIDKEMKRKQEEEMKRRQEEKENNKKKSLEHKTKGNEYYTAKNFQKAIEEYTIAIVFSIDFYIKIVS